MANQLKRIGFTVQGTVQGVFFRDRTQKKANELGITGWVRNASDPEKVEGEAQSSSDANMTKFKDYIKDMPKPAKVLKHKFTDLDAEQGESGFQVRH